MIRDQEARWVRYHSFSLFNNYFSLNFSLIFMNFNFGRKTVFLSKNINRRPSFLEDDARHGNNFHNWLIDNVAIVALIYKIIKSF